MTLHATPPDISETELVARARRGDVAAFETLVRRHERKLFSFALAITGGKRELAEDLLQEALIRAYRNIRFFRGECSFVSWIWRILRNDFAQYKSSRRWEGEEEESTEPREEKRELSPEKEFIHAERVAHIRSILSRLRIDDQEAITLIEFQRLSLDEAATLLDVSLAAFKSRLHRARKRFVALVKKNKNLFS